ATLAALRYHRASNMPYWKLDKYVRRLLGPNPLRAHDAIGPGASFLTWSCLHHLTEHYGPLFTPDGELERRRKTGESWYSSNRPTVDWNLDDEDEFNAWILGPIFQMTSLMLHENRAHYTHMNAIGELCAQFANGVLAMVRNAGADKVISQVEAYHKLHPEAAKKSWYPDAFSNMDTPEWKQLYVNAEHDDQFGVVTISRESLNWDVINELNSAIDWLKNEGVENVVLTGDFHLSTQLVGADTTEFYPALTDAAAGIKVAQKWSETARRFHDEFKVSVGFINGKRCLGGMLELMMHCHFLVALDDAQVGMPEVTLPVIPGMEGCHWALRKARTEDYPNIIQMLLTGRFMKASATEGWLIDYVGSMDDCLATINKIVTGGKHGLSLRSVNTNPITINPEISGIPGADNPITKTARKAIMDCVTASCSASLNDALMIQARHSGAFMVTKECLKGTIGQSWKKTFDL
ncbi:enoyl-CoA hydratase/isomerase family protein, partial [bacterium]|nr:enoyl-CoA hydratase/isomerase family protein [bacterium]